MTHKPKPPTWSAGTSPLVGTTETFLFTNGASLENSMCGRFTLRTPMSVLVETFRFESTLQLALRFNTAPTQDVAVVQQRGDERVMCMQRWGFFPSWEKEPLRSKPLFNARDDGLTKNRSFFRPSFQKRRCLVLADGFFEWKKIDKNTKLAHYIRRQDERPFGFAGLWTSWNEIQACTIVTTQANELMKPLHDRMPVVIDPTDYDAWLNCEVFDQDALLDMLRPFDSTQWVALQVSDRVNSWRNDDESCIEPLTT